MGGSGDSLSLKVILQAQDLASGSLKGFGATLVNLAGDAGPLLSAMLGISAVVIAFGVASVQMAAQYQQSMNMVQALTGASNAQMAQYDAGLKNLAIDAGVAPAALSQGLYQVISAGYSGAQAMNVLTLATEDSKIGMTSAATTADSLTNVLANFTWQTKDANQVNGIMLETVTLGKSTFEQYASTITKASSVSAQFHISLQTMSAAWATMTSSGIRAAQASTDFQQLAIGMYSKIGTITKSLEKNGIAFNENAFNAASFKDKVLMLNTALEQARAKHVTVTGVTVQAAAAIQAISGHIDAYNSNLATLSDSQAMSQKTAEAWGITQDGLNQQLSRAQAAIQVLMIDVGQQLLPVLTRLVSVVAPVVMWLISFSSAVSQNQVAMAFLQGALVGFVVVVLALLIPAFWAWAVAAGAAALATLAATWPILAIGLAVAVIVAGIILAVKNWGAISQWLVGVWSGVPGFFAGIGSDIQNTFSGIGKFIGGVWDGLGSGVKSAVNGVIGIINGFISNIDGIGIDFGGVHIHANIPKIPLLFAGGTAISSGLAVVGDRGPELLNLPVGAQITPLQGYNSMTYGQPPSNNSYSNNSMAGGNMNVSIVVNGAGQSPDVIARLVMDQLNRQYRRSGVMGNSAAGVRNS